MSFNLEEFLTAIVDFCDYFYNNYLKDNKPLATRSFVNGYLKRKECTQQKFNEIIFNNINKNIIDTTL